MRALLLEPDSSTREQLLRSLTDRGWRVTVAGSRADALESFRADPVPLVVLGCEDLEEPELSLCREIRGGLTGQDAFLLVVAAAGPPEAVRQLGEAGVDDFLLRPVSPTELSGRIVFAEGRIAAPAEHRPGVGARRSAAEPPPDPVQHALLEGLFRSAPEGIAVVDEDDRIVRVNAEFYRMFGYSETEARGRRIDELIIPEQLSAEAATLTEGVRQGERFALETVRRHRDGSLVDVSVLATPLHAGGRLIGGYAMYRDTTERRAQEQALQESEARYRALFDQSPVGVFLCDGDLRITHCNERLTEIVGAGYDDIVGTRLLDLQDARILPGLAQALSGDTAFYEGPYRATHSGRRLWISVRYAPLRAPDGTVIGGTGVLEDISSREEAQQQLRAQAAELERVNEALRERTLELEAALQARSRLYSALNHELRTPISAVMLYQELLLAGTMGPLSGDQQEALERSHSAAGHLLELVQDVLDLSKIEAGSVSVHPVEVHLPLLLRNLRDTVLPLAQRYGSEIHLDVERGQRPVITDPQRLRQILLNLLSNAAKYGRGSAIELRCRTKESGESCFEVSDQGVGIAAADLPRIFEDFVQVGSAQEGGTGLGLAISKRLAGLLGGRLEVDSELGAGSTFRLVLPPYEPAGENAAREGEA